MKLKPKITIADHFAGVGRSSELSEHSRHQLIDIVTISICAVICGADTWVDIESYGRSSIRRVKAILRITEWHTDP